MTGFVEVFGFLVIFCGMLIVRVFLCLWVSYAEWTSLVLLLDVQMWA